MCSVSFVVYWRILGVKWGSWGWWHIMTLMYVRRPFWRYRNSWFITGKVLQYTIVFVLMTWYFKTYCFSNDCCYEPNSINLRVDLCSFKNGCNKPIDDRPSKPCISVGKTLTGEERERIQLADIKALSFWNFYRLFCHSSIACSLQNVLFCGESQANI